MSPHPARVGADRLTSGWDFAVAVRSVGGRHRAKVRDLPEVEECDGAESGALDDLANAIEVAVLDRMAKGEPLPPRTTPAEGDRTVPLPARSAAKAAVYDAWTRAGITKSELARRMGRDVVEVRRILAPRHGTKLDQLDEAARALGMRFVVGLVPLDDPGRGEPID